MWRSGHYVEPLVDTHHYAASSSRALCRRRSLSPVLSPAYHARPAVHHQHHVQQSHHSYGTNYGFANYEETRAKLVELQRRLELTKREFLLKSQHRMHSPLPAHGYRATSSSLCLVEPEWRRAVSPIARGSSAWASHYGTVSTLDAQLSGLKSEIAALQHQLNSKDATIYSMQRSEETLRHENHRLHATVEGIDNRLQSLRNDLETVVWM